MEHREALVALVGERLRSRTTDDWLGSLRGRVPVAPVYTVAEALADPQVVAREMVVEVPHPVFGTLRQVGSPIKLAGVTPRYRAASALGADTDDLLAEIGVGDAARSALRDRGIV
jgi:crotonobetainyl-CoA:carnitine CoA-transferase CaiB-like acyl-CoA transferase